VSSNGHHAAGPQVAYIGSTSRSGSTVLELLLGDVPGFVAIGELRHLWQRGVVGNQLCGCGQPFHDCPFWNEVGRRAFGGWDEESGREVVALQRRVDRFRHLPLQAAPGLWPPFRRLLDTYAERTARVYEAVADVSGADVVVDSSKAPGFAMMVGRIPGVRMHLIHLVRDSRGVAYSWRRKVRRPETGARGPDMPTIGPGRVALEWTLWNAVFEVLRRRTGGTRTSYESLIEHPSSELRRIAERAGGHPEATADAQTSGGALDVGVHHTVSGNRVRFHKGPLELRVDDEWRTSMPLRDRTIVTLMTWPLLLAYRRLGRAAAPPPAVQGEPQRYAARPAGARPGPGAREPVRPDRQEHRPPGHVARTAVSSGDGHPHRR
jgi:hypothetical protein